MEMKGSTIRRHPFIITLRSALKMELDFFESTKEGAFNSRSTAIVALHGSTAYPVSPAIT